MARDANSTLVFDLPTTVGALEVSSLIALFLSGILTVQVRLYFQKSSHDHWGLKFLVSLAWALDIGHTVALCHTLYTITITQYGHPEKLIILPLSFDIASLLGGFIGPLSQGWFTYRLYKLSKRLYLALFCILIAGLRFIAILRACAIGLHAYPLPEFVARTGWLMEAIFITSASLDTFIMLALCYYVSSWRKDQSPRVQKVLTQIITYFIETGAMSIIGALTVLISFLTLEGTWIFIGSFFILAKLFSNALLLSLNARERFAQLLHDKHVVTTPLTRTAVQLGTTILLSTAPSPSGNVGSAQFRTHRTDEYIGDDVSRQTSELGQWKPEPDRCA